MQAFIHILTNNIIPIFTLIFIGYILNKKFNLDINTLSKLNFYAFVPFFIFVNLYTTDIPMEMVKVIVFAAAILLGNMVMGRTISLLRKHDTSMKSAFGNSVMFYNSGNVGLPLITLVFSSAPFILEGKTPYLELAVTTQVAVLVVQNITTNTIGFLNAASAHTHWQDSLRRILRMPAIYVIPLVFIFKAMPVDLTKFPLWPAFMYAKNGLVPIALITLGVQLSKTRFELKNKDVYFSTVVRLIGGPVLAFFLVRLMGFEGVMAQTLMISSSVPTAVNSALIAVEYNNHPDFASQVVMTSTLFSAITLSLVIFMARILFPVA